MHNDCTKLGLQRSLLRGLKLLIVRRFQLLIILFKSKMFIRALVNGKRSCFVLYVEREAQSLLNTYYSSFKDGMRL